MTEAAAPDADLKRLHFPYEMDITYLGRRMCRETLDLTQRNPATELGGIPDSLGAVIANIYGWDGGASHAFCMFRREGETVLTVFVPNRSADLEFFLRHRARIAERIVDELRLYERGKPHAEELVFDNLPAMPPPTGTE